MDSTIELVVWIFFSISTALLVLNFYFDVDFLDISESISSTLSFQKDDFSYKNYESFSKERYILETLEVWEDCAYGRKNTSYILRYNDTSTLNDTSYFTYIKTLGLCYVISNNDSGIDCGNKVDLENIPNLSGDILTKISCNSTSNMLVISR